MYIGDLFKLQTPTSEQSQYRTNFDLCVAARWLLPTHACGCEPPGASWCLKSVTCGCEEVRLYVFELFKFQTPTSEQS